MRGLYFGLLTSACAILGCGQGDPSAQGIDVGALAEQPQEEQSTPDPQPVIEEPPVVEMPVVPPQASPSEPVAPVPPEFPEEPAPLQAPPGEPAAPEPPIVISTPQEPVAPEPPEVPETPVPVTTPPVEPTPPVAPEPPDETDLCQFDAPVVRDGRQTFLLLSDDGQTCVRLERMAADGPITSKGRSYNLLRIIAAHDGQVMSSVGDEGAILTFYTGQHGVGGRAVALLDDIALDVDWQLHWLQRSADVDLRWMLSGIPRESVSNPNEVLRATTAWGPITLSPVDQ